MQKNDPQQQDDILLVHGLGGCAASGYMLRFAAKGILRGFNVHRMNLRGCGESLAQCRLPYHSGLWKDIYSVIENVTIGKKLFIIGFSLGGNMLLKMAGDLAQRFPTLVSKIAAVSPPLNLAIATDWIQQQKFYHKYFLNNLIARYLRRKSMHPEVYRGLLKLRPRTIEEFDEYVTAKLYGFCGAQDYYRQTSCGRVLPGISVPTMIVYAQDDPLIPAHDYREHRDKLQNKAISLMELPRGGHVAFIARDVMEGDMDRFWADERIFQWFNL